MQAIESCKDVESAAEDIQTNTNT